MMPNPHQSVVSLLSLGHNRLLQYMEQGFSALPLICQTVRKRVGAFCDLSCMIQVPPAIKVVSYLSQCQCLI